MIETSIQFLSCPPPILRSPCGGLLRRQLHALPDAEEENQESAPVTPGGALTDRSLPAQPFLSPNPKSETKRGNWLTP